VIEKYYSRLTLDFQTNKRICDEVAIIPSKRLRNKIAGFVTHLMTRIQKGPVRGISLKLQEEERERRMDYVPEVSAVETDVIEVDAETKDMLRALDLANLPGVVLQSSSGAQRDTGRRGYGDRRGGGGYGDRR
jgi:small subunit ribosomal protein S17e